MISRFIFGTESAGWKEIGGLGGLTRFGPGGVFGRFRVFIVDFGFQAGLGAPGLNWM